MPTDAGSTAPGASDFTYSGRFGPILRLALVTGLITLLTVGIYRFWATARLRRYVWGSVRVGGDALEYTGTGLEKFVGFLFAVVVLALWLGAVQIVLFLFGVVIVADPRTEEEALAQALALSASSLAVVPFVFFAQYRARRYKLARTRLRGIRFGMEPAAWGYVWRALGHGALTVVTLGLLLPRQTFALEAYMTNRSFFGDARFAQGGRWTALYRYLRHVGIGVAILIAGGVLTRVVNDFGLFLISVGFFLSPLFGPFLMFVGFVWAFLGFVHYNVQSFGWLARHKTLAGGVGFDARPSTGRVIWIGLVGWVVIAVVFAILGLVIFAMAADSFGGAAQGGGPPPVGALVVSVLGYLAAFVLTGALATALISQPILRHYIETCTITGIGALDGIVQRAPDRGADAEGFADALDMGGAF
jgi:uncharacterized membrane protein YjgN (DUF898 family)